MRRLGLPSLPVTTLAETPAEPETTGVRVALKPTSPVDMVRRTIFAMIPSNWAPKAGREVQFARWGKVAKIAGVATLVIPIVGGVVDQWRRDSGRVDLSTMDKARRSLWRGSLRGVLTLFGSTVGAMVGVAVGAFGGTLSGAALGGIGLGRRGSGPGAVTGAVRGVFVGAVTGSLAGGAQGAWLGRNAAYEIADRTEDHFISPTIDEWRRDGPGDHGFYLPKLVDRLLPESALRAWNDEMKKSLGTDHRRPVLSVLGEGLGVSDRESTHELVSLPPPPSEPVPVSPPPDNLEQILEQLADNPPAPPPIIVGDGDSLWRIVERRLGPGASGADIQRAVDAIYDANVEAIGIDPDQILPGTQLGVPEAAQ